MYYLSIKIVNKPIHFLVCKMLLKNKVIKLIIGNILSKCNVTDNNKDYLIYFTLKLNLNISLNTKLDIDFGLVRNFTWFIYLLN